MAACLSGVPPRVVRLNRGDTPFDLEESYSCRRPHRPPCGLCATTISAHRTSCTSPTCRTAHGGRAGPGARAGASPGAGELPIIAGHRRRFVRTTFPAGVGGGVHRHRHRHRRRRRRPAARHRRVAAGAPWHLRGDRRAGHRRAGPHGPRAAFDRPGHRRLPARGRDHGDEGPAGQDAPAPQRAGARARGRRRRRDARGAAGSVHGRPRSHGLASAPSLERMLGAGAQRALDHRATRPADLGRFDVIVDLVGTDLPAYVRLLASGGRMVPLALDPLHPLRATALVLWQGLRTRGWVRTFSNNPSSAQLDELAALVDAAALRPAVERTYPLRGDRRGVLAPGCRRRAGQGGRGHDRPGLTPVAGGSRRGRTRRRPGPAHHHESAPA